jgi:hypothetical protein
MADPALQQLVTSAASTAATTTVNFTAASAGDLLLLTIAADDYRTTTGTGRPESSGWTLPTGGGQETFIGHYLWYKIAAGGETSVQYTIGSAVQSAHIFARYNSVSGFDISNGQFAQSTAASYTTPTVTPTAGRRFAVAAIGGCDSSRTMTGVGTWLNSYSEVADIRTTPASGQTDEVGLAVLAFDATGSSTTSSGASYEGQSSQARTGIIAVFQVASADTTPPSVPTGLHTTAVGSTTADLTWTASTDDVAVTGYEILVIGP